MRVFLGVITLFLPGLCWWVWLGRRDEDPVEVLAKVVGVSISIDALLALLFFILKIKINLVGLMVIMAIWLGLIAWGIFKRRDIKLGWTWVFALLGFGAVIAWRLFQARALLVPAWVDSLHHVLIVRKIIEFGGLPPDLSPYLDVTFYYHYVFHIFAAQFSVLSGLSPDQAVLLIGQVINAAIGLSVYALGKVLFKDWRPALLAGLLVTFVTKIPAYYLTWGRYTLMTGMILLPLAMAKAIRLLEPGHRRTDWVEMALFTAGTLLAHYFTGIILALFLVCLGVGYLLRAWKMHTLEWRPLLFLVLSALAGFLIVLPWLLRVFINTRMTLGVSTNLPAEIGMLFNNQDQWQYLWYLLGDKGGYVVLFGSILGLALAFTRSKYRELAGWGTILSVLALPRGLSLGSFRFDHFAIVLFLPLVILFSLYISESVRLLDRLTQKKWPVWVLAGLIGFGAIIWGGFETKDIINPKTVFTTQADLDAIKWIDKNLPQDARFFINTTAWGYGVSRGVDGGAWIMPLTGRWTVAPTLFYTFGGDLEHMKQIMDWGKQAQNVTGCSDSLWKLVKAADLTHIYLRDDVGRLTAGALVECVGIEKVYEEDGVGVWEIGN
jgi:hypothetical protein